MYYKILSEDLKHHNMQYQEGLNVNCERTILNGKCGDGLFFSDEKHILDFCDYGTKISEVELPEGEPVSDCEDKFKAHRIILKNIRNLWDIDVLKELIDQGADVHADNDYALQLASKYGHLEIVKYLVEQGADIHASDNYALRCASECGHLEIVKYLVEQGADIHANSEKALQLASKYGHLEIVKYLVEQGADIHASDNYALQLASKYGHLEVLKYLVEQGANVHADNDLALRWASENGHLEVVKYIIEQGADIRAIKHPFLYQINNIIKIFKRNK